MEMVFDAKFDYLDQIQPFSLDFHYFSWIKTHLSSWINLIQFDRFDQISQISLDY